MVSQSEVDVIKKCRLDSLLQRSLPLATLFSIGTYRMMRKQSAKWIIPMVFINGSAGYLIGKLSYVPVCIEKLMELPESEIGNFIRKRRYGITQNPEDEPVFYKDGEKYSDEYLRRPPPESAE